MNRINIIIFRTVMLGVFAIAMLFIAGPSAFADDDHGCTPGHEHIGSCGGTDGQTDKTDVTVSMEPTVVTVSMELTEPTVVTVSTGSTGVTVSTESSITKQ